MSDLQRSLNTYAAYMTEIRYRTDVISRTIRSLQAGGTITRFRESDLELIYLQFRHCLELMMFASLVAHDGHGYELSKRMLKSEYNATKLLKFIKKKNPNFYPSPVSCKDGRTLDGMYVNDEIEDGVLTEEDFCKLYDQTCGNMLHAQRASKFDGKHDSLIQEADYYCKRMMRLLTTHWINITDKLAFSVIMNTKGTGKVSVQVMEVVGEMPQKPMVFPDKST